MNFGIVILSGVMDGPIYPILPILFSDKWAMYVLEFWPENMDGTDKEIIAGVEDWIG